MLHSLLLQHGIAIPPDSTMAPSAEASDGVRASEPLVSGHVGAISVSSSLVEAGQQSQYSHSQQPRHLPSELQNQTRIQPINPATDSSSLHPSSTDQYLSYGQPSALQPMSPSIGLTTIFGDDPSVMGILAGQNPGSAIGDLATPGQPRLVPAPDPRSQTPNADEHSYGTLVISRSGRSKYLGRTAASEWLKNVCRRDQRRYARG
jgi:hypothetical protein